MTTIYDNFGATPLTLGGRVRLGRRAHVQSSERTEQQPGLCASCMRHVCVVYVSCVRHVCVMCASCMRHVCVMHASCVRHACVMCSSCVCHACAMFAPCLRRVCVMHAHVCVMCASCVRAYDVSGCAGVMRVSASEYAKAAVDILCVMLSRVGHRDYRSAR